MPIGNVPSSDHSNGNRDDGLVESSDCPLGMDTRKLVFSRLLLFGAVLRIRVVFGSRGSDGFVLSCRKCPCIERR